VRDLGGRKLGDPQATALVESLSSRLRGEAVVPSQP
jgi:hypothetical protein